MARLSDLLRERAPSDRPTDPISVFNGLRLTGSGIQEMWAPQADALRAWHEARTSPDVLFKMNTGAGKTLVGLVAAQAIANEGRMRVLYTCATNQLLEQTAQKADEYGMEVATYYQGNWSAEQVYTRSEGPCLTNYHALFNGRSIFSRDALTPTAVIFDDAHTALSIVRSQFTVAVDRGFHPGVYASLTTEVRQYFEDVGRGVVFTDVVSERDIDSVLFVPLFVSSPRADVFAGILRDAGLTDEGPASFAWQHLRHQLRHCAMLFRHSRIEFTPLAPPVHALPAFSSNVRRIYMSATLDVSASFCRTFGREPSLVIEPGGRAGETERMILPAPRDSTDADAIEWARQVVGERKCLVMVPSKRAATTWQQPFDVFESEGQDRIDQFAASADEKLVLVARYDGIDLPGDACRILIVDGLPLGASLLELFYEGHLGISAIGRETVATRIVQLLGRISRGLDDPGVFILLGRRLLRWLDAPHCRTLLPDHIRNQLALGDGLAERYADFPAAQLLEQCLDRDSEWIELYSQHMSGTIDAGEERAENLTAFALAEVEYVRALWSGDSAEAAAALLRVRTPAFEIGRSLGAWYLHWVGHALAEAGDGDQAAQEYHQAGRVRPEVGKFALPYEPRRATRSKQAESMLSYYEQHRQRAAARAREVANCLADRESTPGQNEEAVRLLGDLLALETARPDKDSGTGEGPDVVWHTPSKDRIFLFELKTDKDPDSQYRKDELGQVYQHIQWAQHQFGEVAQHRMLVGPRSGHTSGSLPPDDVWIVSPEEMSNLAGRVAAIYELAEREELAMFLPATFAAGIEDMGLRWEEIVDNLEKLELVYTAAR